MSRRLPSSNSTTAAKVSLRARALSSTPLTLETLDVLRKLNFLDPQSQSAPGASRRAPLHRQLNDNLSSLTPLSISHPQKARPAPAPSKEALAKRARAADGLAADGDSVAVVDTPTSVLFAVNRSAAAQTADQAGGVRRDRRGAFSYRGGSDGEDRGKRFKSRKDDDDDDHSYENDNHDDSSSEEECPRFSGPIGTTIFGSAGGDEGGGSGKEQQAVEPESKSDPAMPSPC